MNKPKHVAIIMDGNGRWGLKKKNSRNFGHKQGIQTVEIILKKTIEKKNTLFNFVFFLNRKLEKTQRRDKIFTKFN